ncbi:MAG: PQQ-binding-like beta-propeller repeat protein [Pirellulaceae bacterium]
MKFAFGVVILGTVTSATALADSWPHWMGPQRDNVWREEGILDKFPEGGPTVLWRTKIDGGYSGPAVDQGKVVITDYVTADNVKVANFERKEFTGVERIHCLDEQTGKIQWTHEYPVKYAISYPSGPRCTPVIEENLVFTLGAEGNLFCFNLTNGEVVWSKDLKTEYNTKAALWGYAAHPLIDGNKLICTVGGEGTHAVAFDKKTGKELWRSLTAPEQGYSPPTIIDYAGVRQLILPRPDAISSVNPDTGEEYWSVPYEASNGSIIMSPIHFGEYLYIGGYSNKNLMLKLDSQKPSAEAMWQDEAKHAISPVNVQPIRDGNTMYGFDQNGALMAIDLPSGDRLWQTSEPLADRPPGSGTAFIVRQADRYWLFTENGDLIICKLSREGYQELDRTHVIEPSNVAFGRDVVWSMPAFANQRAYIRNDNEIICVQLAQ